MADYGNPIAGLYPQPAQPQQNALAGNPLSLIPAIIGLQQLGAQRAVGNAFQAGVGPGGAFDPSATLTAIGNSPAAALAAPGAVTTALAARGQNISNATAQLGLGIANNSALASILAPYANEDTISPSDQAVIKAKLAAANVDPATVAAADINGAMKSVKAARLAQVQAAGAPNAMSRQSVLGPNGEIMAPTVGSLAVGSGGAPVQTGLSPSDQADLTAWNADKAKSSAILGAVRPLEQALPLVQQLNHFSFGPASGDIAKVNGLLTTLGLPVIPFGDDAKQNELSVRQEINKKLLGYASMARDAGRSDNALSTSIESNPNVDLTQPAGVNLIKTQIGMDKQDAAVSQATGGAWKGYQNFKSQWYNATDPRGFVDIGPDDAANYAKSLKGGERDKVNRSIGIARQLGFVQPPQSGGQ